MRVAEFDISRSIVFHYTAALRHRLLIIIIIIIIIIIFISVKTYRSTYNDDIYMYIETSVTQDRNNRFRAVGCQTVAPESDF